MGVIRLCRLRERGGGEGKLAETNPEKDMGDTRQLKQSVNTKLTAWRHQPRQTLNLLDVFHMSFTILSFC